MPPRHHRPSSYEKVNGRVRFYSRGVRIGELAELAHVSTKTIRYYESVGIMPPPERTPAGYRDYDDGAVDRLRFVRDAQAAGLSLAEIQSVLEMKDAGAQTCEHTRGLLQHHLLELDRQIERLQAARSELAELADRARTSIPPRAPTPTAARSSTHRCRLANALDLPVDWKAYGRIEGQRRVRSMTATATDPTTTDLVVEGMTCGSCAARIQQALASQPGVVDAEVNFATARAQGNNPRGR